MDRIDKILSNLGYGSRKEIKAYIKKGFVYVNGIVIKDNSMEIEPLNDEITFDGEKVNYRKYIYLMMNKPQGVVSATFDNFDKTVIDLLSQGHKNFSPFPVGRLDKDTVGLLLLTNDGELNHRLISPKYHVKKIYYAKIDGMVDENDVEAFKNCVVLDDGYKCLPAALEIIKKDVTSEVLVTIEEGKFHQVKRMFESVNKKVVFLKRISFGGLKLDNSLCEGNYKELSDEEVTYLKSL